MAETPKEFPQTGADGQGQISPPMGEFWLPHGNSAPPGGISADFGAPSYMAGADDVYVPDYHPPTRIPDHPFKVNRFYDEQEGEWKIRVREGRFYLTTNASSKGVATAASVDGDTVNFFALGGDDGFPSFGNSTAALAPALALPAEFTDDDAANGYAFLTENSTNFDHTQVNWVHLRYVLKHNTTGIALAGIDNDLNVISVPQSSIANATEGAVNKPINAAAVVDKDGDDEIMRLDQTVVSSLNGLAISGDRERYGVYYILLAKIEATGTATGPIVTQYIHENITLSVSNTPVTAYSTGYGEA